jgi:hypothetical protein
LRQHRAGHAEHAKRRQPKAIHSCSLLKSPGTSLVAASDEGKGLTRDAL